MNPNPMTAQVALLVGNLLSGEGEVHLPGIGSLYTERIAARRLSKRSVAPPCRIVMFSSQQQGTSLVDAIARAAQCPPAEAQEIYDRWLARVQDADTLTIEGVGALRFKNFTLTDAFDMRLNPQGHAPMRIVVRRRFDWVLWLGVAAILVAGGIFGYQFLPSLREVPAPTPIAVRTAPAVIQPDTLVKADTADVAAPVTGRDSTAVTAKTTVAAPVKTPATPATPVVPATTARPAPAPVAQTAPATSALASFSAGTNYVVLGVFSTEANVARGIREILAKDASMKCTVYPFRGKFLVAAFESTDAEACAQFIRANNRFSGLWIYTAR